MNDDRSRERTGERPSPDQRVDDWGLASPEPASTDGESEPDSALGGGTATRSRPKPPPDPAEERSE